MGDERAIIGSRRLAIIDLDTGRQPMTTTDGSIVVSQNGEIYNYVELREELLRRGHTLATHGDTEVIGHLYQEFGDDFVDDLRGMFAIALWDKPRQRLILARDRLGKKPIYWRLADGRLSYGLGDEGHPHRARRRQGHRPPGARPVPRVSVRPRPMDDPARRPQAAARLDPDVGRR